MPEHPSEKPGQKTVYFDCYNGISGDMALGALIDGGVDLKELQELLSGLKLKGWNLSVEKITRGSIAGIRALVNLEESDGVERHLGDILSILDQADLPPVVRQQSRSVFECLAEAEASVHGISVDRVHFHEVGALDAIIDITGTCAALYLLGADRLVCSPLPAGRGEVECAHGRLPLPAPATLELLAKYRAPVEGRDAGYELVTPTGAALAVALADSFGPIPAFNVTAVGYGAGSIDPGYANYLRILIGTTEPEETTFEEKVAVLETTIDDLNPEIYSYLMEKLFEAGSLDVYYTPVQMKKNRPGVHLTVLSPPEKMKTVQDIIFEETTTLGFRLTEARKVMRPRDTEIVQTRWGPVRIKYSPGPAGLLPLHYSPEYEDCKLVAEQSGLPLKEVYRLLDQIFRGRFNPSGEQ